eukprot:CAMPEP_0114260460 /NCGR_PEP_ID=MMETSP0058-20121206/20504_1 /TAXON_ID=36894 /ORGANISM="Pyramimonas parkeae, CCMP726" /LENGTH=160 /DNA_ID=CAMNT_0001375707 /DNA_START=738 /DNA_END=1217 /DNA_ORIENTATION=+
MSVRRRLHLSAPYPRHSTRRPAGSLSERGAAPAALAHALPSSRRWRARVRRAEWKPYREDGVRGALGQGWFYIGAAAAWCARVEDAGAHAAAPSRTGRAWTHASSLEAKDGAASSKHCLGAAFGARAIPCLGSGWREGGFTPPAASSSRSVDRGLAVDGR